tara:strand:+ start:3228 stop:4679 length:1452 start_codon:yes stop_codon:yes gene_type:complete
MFDYGTNFQGFGNGTSDQVAELHKAMTAGTGSQGFTHGTATAGNLAPLMPESLEATLKVMTYSERQIKFWREIFKSNASNTAEEYNRLHQVGSGEAAFIGEGDLPEIEDSSYSREVSLVKFLGTTRKVSHVASIVKTAGIQNAIAQETKNGTLWLMRQIEHSLWFGDSSLIPEQWDGFKKLFNDSGAIKYDMRGAPLTQDVLNGLCGVVRSAPNYGQVDTLWTSIGVKSDLSNIIRTDQRAMYGSVVTLGNRIDAMETQHGSLRIEDSVFIREGLHASTTAIGDAAKIPSAPTHLATIVGGAQGGLWIDGSAGVGGVTDLATYEYQVVAINRYGRSVPSAKVAIAAPIAVGESISLEVTPGATKGAGYIIYRTKNDDDGGTAVEVARVAHHVANNNAIYIDVNQNLPACSDVFGVEMSPNTLGFKQLAPFTRIPLATIDTSIRWMQVLYGVPVLYRPRHNFIIANVGRASSSPVFTPSIVGFE